MMEPIRKDRRFEPVARMAEAIIAIVKEKGDCLPQDLLPLGFTKLETVDHYHMAKSLAAVELKIMGEETTNSKFLMGRP